MVRCAFYLLPILLLTSCGRDEAVAASGPAIELQEVAHGLRHPVYVTHDGTERLFIVEQEGKVRLLQDGKLVTVPYLNIRNRVAYGGECGLLSIAFHPKFSENGYFYANYTCNEPNLHTVISEFKTTASATKVDPKTERIILTIDQPYANHNGGQIKFGPDGMLYIGMGDGGSAGDPHDNGQNQAVMLGKMLRIDINTRDGYRVPEDNPFVSDERFRPEIWAWGLRNPWRFSFDRKTGDIYAGDVGQIKYEEIDVIVRGGNYGWRRREGLHQFQDESDFGDYIDPIAEYGRDKGVSVTGGYVYRGKEMPALNGLYFYGDYGSGRFWALRWENGRVLSNDELEVTADGRPVRNRIQPSSFGEDAAGELYVCDHGGRIYKIAAK